MSANYIFIPDKEYHESTTVTHYLYLTQDYFNVQAGSRFDGPKYFKMFRYEGNLERLRIILPTKLEHFNCGNYEDDVFWGVPPESDIVFNKDDILYTIKDVFWAELIEVLGHGVQ